MQRIIITGNLGRDPEQRSAGNDNVTSFTVGVRQGWGDRASSNWFRCSVWGKRGDTIRDRLTKGMKVTVIGELTIGEYQGKPQYEVRVDDIDWQPAGQRDDRGSDQRGNGNGGGRRGGYRDDPAGDLDDDVPFISADPSLEARAR